VTSIKTLLIVIKDADWFFSHRLPAALEAQQRGYRVVVAVPLNKQDQRFAVHGFEVVSTTKKPILFVYQLKKVIEGLKPDIVHIFCCQYVLLAGVLCRVIGYKNMVFTFAGLGFLFQSKNKWAGLLRGLSIPYLRYALTQPTAKIIVQNADDARCLLKHKLCKAKQLRIIYGSGVDLKHFVATPMPKEPIKTVLMPSRLLRSKGVIEFCQAAQILKKQDIQAKFVLAGDFYPKHPDRLNPADIDVYRHSETIEYIGHVEDIASRMRQAYMVVLPSYYPEGLPKVLLEAAASARPIVTTDHTGCRDIVDNGKEGLLVPIQNPEALAKAIKELLLDTVKATAMGKAGRSRIEHGHDSQIIAKKTCDVYEEK
jgi:glycosyltransferase involved in cell wall biosynthesis